MRQRKEQLSENKSDGDAMMISPATSYTIAGWHFDVERVFNHEASDTLGMVLLKLIEAEIAPF